MCDNRRTKKKDGKKGCQKACSYEYRFVSFGSTAACYARWGSEELRSWEGALVSVRAGGSSDELPVYNAASPSSEMILISRMILISGMSLISICKLLFSISISKTLNPKGCIFHV